MAETNICASIQMTFLHGAITHQISDTRLQHARHIRIFSRADKTTQASSPEAGSQAEAEEASGDGQLNDRLIDSPNHADVHFVVPLSIWDWPFSALSLSSSILSVPQSVHFSSSYLLRFHCALFPSPPSSHFSNPFSHARYFSCGCVGAYNFEVAYVCLKFPRASVCLWSCLCTSVRLQPCLYRMREGKVASVRVHGPEAVCARVWGLQGCKGLRMAVDSWALLWCWIGLACALNAHVRVISDEQTSPTWRHWRKEQ